MRKRCPPCAPNWRRVTAARHERHNMKKARSCDRAFFIRHRVSRNAVRCCGEEDGLWRKNKEPPAEAGGFARAGACKDVAEAVSLDRKHPQKGGSDSEPPRGRLQPSRRAERALFVAFCGKGGARERADGFFFAKGKKEVGAKRTLLRRGWAGWIRTSGMTESKSVALPLGDSPLWKNGKPAFAVF